MCFVADEENHIQELSSQVGDLQETVHKQREEMRLLEHSVSQKHADLEVVCFMFFTCYLLQKALCIETYAACQEIDKFLTGHI